MLIPSLFGEDLFDGWFDSLALKGTDRTDRRLYGRHARMLMKTDVYEKEDNYELDISLPGFKKDELTVESNNGHLAVDAAKGLDEEKKDQDDKPIWQERYSGFMQRNLYVGTHVKEEDVKAKLEQGILKLSIPGKAEARLPERKTILIEE